MGYVFNFQRIVQSNPQYRAIARQPPRRRATAAVTQRTGGTSNNRPSLYRRPLKAQHGIIHHIGTHLRGRLRHIGGGNRRHRDHHAATPTGATAAVCNAQQAHPARAGTTLPPHAAGTKHQQQKHRQRNHNMRQPFHNPNNATHT